MAGTTAPESTSEQAAKAPDDEPVAGPSGREATPMPHTGRKRSSAVVPTRARARSWSSTPGSETITPVPVREISGSATPRPSTRSRMIETAWSSISSVAGSVAASRTDTPPCRSRPSRGSLRHTTVMTEARTLNETIPISRTS